MEIFLTTFTAVATLLFIGVLGFWIIARRIIAGSVLGALSVLAIDIALPCLTIAGILRNFQPERDRTWWSLPLWWAGFTVLAFLLTVTLSLIARREFRREFMVSAFFQNGLFFPIAILAQMHGADSPILVSLFLFTLFYPALFFNAAPLFFSRGAGIDYKKVFNPILIGTVLAVAMRLFGADRFIPGFVVTGIGLVGAMTVPLLMLVLGGNIYQDLKGTDRFEILEAAKFVLVKNIIFPALTLLVLTLVKPSYEIAMIIMLQSAVPPVTAIPIITEREGGNRNITNQYLVASFLFSLVSLPVMVMLFRIFTVSAP